MAALARAFLMMGGLAFAAPAMHARQTPASPQSTPTPTQAPASTPAPATPAPAKPAAPTRPPTAADSAACTQIVNYVFQHQELIQEAQRLQAREKAAEISALPDSVRADLAAAITKGKDQGDRLKTLLTRAMGAEKAKTFDDLMALVLGLPDPVRGAVGTLLGSGRSMTCGA